MKELICLISEKTGVSEEQARIITTLVIDYLNKKLPVPLANELETIAKSDLVPAKEINMVGLYRIP